MCYDESRGVIVATKTWGFVNSPTEVFEIDPNVGVWSNPQPAVKPNFMWATWSRMVYDPVNQVSIVRGYGNGGVHYTWEWDGVAWTQWPNDSVGRVTSFVTGDQNVYLITENATVTAATIYKRSGNAWVFVTATPIATGSTGCDGDRPFSAYYNSVSGSIEWPRPGSWPTTQWEIRSYNVAAGTWALTQVQRSFTCSKPFSTSTGRIVAFWNHQSIASNMAEYMGGDHEDRGLYSDMSSLVIAPWGAENQYDITDEDLVYCLLTNGELYSITVNQSDVEPYGLGCAGSSQAFHQYVSVGSGYGLAIPGRVSDIEVWSTNDPTIAGCLIGTEIAPALDLALFGAPGCFLSVNPNVAINIAVATTASAPRAQVSFSWPYSVAYLGLAFHSQAYAFDASANQLGLVVSQPVKLTLGR